MGARLWQCACLCVCFIVMAPIERAMAEERYLLARGSLEVATMMSDDQLDRLAYDHPGLLGAVELGVTLLPRLDLQLGAVGGGFFSSARATGGLVAPVAGINIHARRDGLVPYLLAEAGPGITDVITRPFFQVGMGIDIPLSQRISMGPALGYAQLVQWDEKRNSTDARYLWAALTLLYRHVSNQPAKPGRDRVVVVHHTVTVEPPASEPLSIELNELLEQALPSQGSRVELLAPVLFAFNSDELEPVGVAMLHEVARELNQRPDIELVSIQGYADNRGSAEYNQALSQKRAQRVLSWLVEHGVTPTRLQVEAEGATNLVESGTSEPEHQQNRRVVFRVLRVTPP